jgi:hypothetical protein
MASIDFFATKGEFVKYVDGVDASTGLDELEASSRPAIKHIRDIIGAATYNALLTHYDAENPPANAKYDQAIKYLQEALANLIIIPRFIHKSSDRNNTDRNLFRYQEEKIIELYNDSAYSALDLLLQYMNADTVTFSDWANTESYKTRQELFLNTADKFEKYYGIDNSDYFFTRIIFIMIEVQKNEIQSRYDNFPDVTGQPNLEYYIGKAIAYESLARACQRFDYTSLPKGIRNNIISENSAVASYKTTEIKTALYNNFHNEALSYYTEIEQEVYKINSLDTSELPEDINDEDEKFYLM